MQYSGCGNPSIQVTSGSNQSLNSGKCALLWSTNHKTLKTTAFCRYLLYRHSSHNREFHNVNCRFCGAIHKVDWACISVLSQVIHNVNEKKNRTEKYDFLCEPWSWDSKNFVKLCFTKFLFRSPAECPANRNIIFVCTVFLFINL